MEIQTPQNPTPIKQDLPNATAILILGILSIIICCGGIIPAIIALILASKAKSLYHSNPQNYTAQSFSNVKTGKICAIIGLILGILTFITYLIAVIAGLAFSNLPMEWGL